MQEADSGARAVRTPDGENKATAPSTFRQTGPWPTCSVVFVQRLILEIFVPSILTPAIKPSWSKMKA